MWQGRLESWSAERFAANPIISPDSHPSVGENVNGPSLIRVPEWLPGARGRYYLYFAAHEGDRIRLATADSLAGPWRVEPSGTLRLDQTSFGGHVASPDVHVDDANRHIRMYFHGCCVGEEHRQFTGVAASEDGLYFRVESERLGKAYWRVFEYGGWYYALEMPGRFLRSRDPFGPFTQGPALFPRQMRHSAVLVRGDTLWVFWTRVRDCPERVLVSRIDLRPNWMEWRASRPRTCLTPEQAWEGGDLPLSRSRRGLATAPEHALRDPAVFEDGAAAYLLYAVAGESGLAIARLRSGTKLPGIAGVPQILRAIAATSMAKVRSRF